MCEILLNISPRPLGWRTTCISVTVTVWRIFIKVHQIARVNSTNTNFRVIIVVVCPTGFWIVQVCSKFWVSVDVRHGCCKSITKQSQKSSFVPSFMWRQLQTEHKGDKKYISAIFPLCEPESRRCWVHSLRAKQSIVLVHSVNSLTAVNRKPNWFQDCKLAWLWGVIQSVVHNELKTLFTPVGV